MLLVCLKASVILLSSISTAYLIGRWFYLKGKMPKKEKALILPIEFIVSIISVWIVVSEKISNVKLSVKVLSFVLIVVLWTCLELLLGLMIEKGMKAYYKSNESLEEEFLEDEEIFNEDDISEEEYQEALENFKQSKFYQAMKEKSQK